MLPYVPRLTVMVIHATGRNSKGAWDITSLYLPKNDHVYDGNINLIVFVRVFLANMKCIYRQRN